MTCVERFTRLAALGAVLLGSSGLADANGGVELAVEDNLVDRGRVLDLAESMLMKKITDRRQKFAELLATLTTHNAHRLRHWWVPETRLSRAHRRLAMRKLVRRSASELAMLSAELSAVRKARVALHDSTGAAAPMLVQLRQPGRFAAPLDPAMRIGDFGHHLVGADKVATTYKGVRWNVPSGQVVKAAATGRVVFAGRLAHSGRVVVLDHGDIRSVTSGLGELLVAVDDHVAQGAPVGRSAGDHVEWQLRVEIGPESMAVDPKFAMGHW